MVVQVGHHMQKPVRDEASELGLGPATAKHLLVWVLVHMIDHEPPAEWSAQDHAATCTVTFAQRDVSVDVEEQPGTVLVWEHALAGMPVHAVADHVFEPTWHVEQLANKWHVLPDAPDSSMLRWPPCLTSRTACSAI